MANVSCKKCGREVASTARWCPDCATPLGKSVKCRSCGNDIPASGRGCHHCGATGTAAFGQRGLVPFLIFLLVVLPGFGLLAYFLNQGHEERKQKMERDHQEWKKKHGFDK